LINSWRTSEADMFLNMARLWLLVRFRCRPLFRCRMKLILLKTV
jgi:hypothetical protein